MFSLIHKKENAHSEGIWACAWGLYKPSSGVTNGDTENGDAAPEENNESLPEKETQYIVTGGLDDIVKVWGWEAGVEGDLSLLHSLEGHSLGVISVDVNEAGTIAASSSLDSTIRLWNLHEGKQVQSIDCGPVEAWSVVFSPNGKEIASGNHSGKINVYNVVDGRLVNTLDTRGRFTYSIAYSKDGKYIASGAIDGFINVFDIESGKLVHTLEGHAMTIRSLAFSPDSQLLLTAADDGHMKLYDVRSSNLVCTLSVTGLGY
ncbi:UNVERIFIED_CONTAM: hypothetical protein GTU68_010040 [Idotea baltica]|nr:hypothetical protein [Idotea baltica]